MGFLRVWYLAFRLKSKQKIVFFWGEREKKRVIEFQLHVCFLFFFHRKKNGFLTCAFMRRCLCNNIKTGKTFFFSLLSTTTLFKVYSLHPWIFHRYQIFLNRLLRRTWVFFFFWGFWMFWLWENKREEKWFRTWKEKIVNYDCFLSKYIRQEFRKRKFSEREILILFESFLYFPKC